MELTLNYATDVNNGFSTISSFTTLNALTWGMSAMNTSYMIVPIRAKSSHWYIFSYVYDTDVSNWKFHQYFQIESTNANIYISLSANYLFILADDDNVILIYSFGIDGSWVLSQTISIGASVGDRAITSDGLYMMYADSGIISGTSTGKAFIYKFNDYTNLFENTSSITPPAGILLFGYSLVYKSGLLFIGAPNTDNGAIGDGIAYSYETADDITWTIENTFSGDALDGIEFGFCMDAYTDGTDGNVVIGAPGYSADAGAVYVFERITNVWQAPQRVVAPAPFSVAGNRFGETGSIYDTQMVIYGDDGGQGAIYLFVLGGVWNIDVKADGITDARFTKVGASEYGYGSKIITNLAVVPVNEDNMLLCSRDGVGYSTSNFIFIDNLVIKNTTDESIYHNANGNTNITFNLNAEISGAFLVALEMANSIETIGSHNDTMYFVERGLYLSVTLEHGNYTGANLATHIQLRMNLVSAHSSYIVSYYAPSGKFSIGADEPFGIGSNQTASFLNSCQDKTLGFYENHLSLLHIFHVSDVAGNLSAPEKIGIIIVEAVPSIAIRNNNPINEVQIVATLNGVSGKYEIAYTEEQSIIIKKKVSELSLMFKDVIGGGDIEINTTDIIMSLKSFD